MKQSKLFDPIPSEKFGMMSREDLESFAKLEQRVRIQLQQQLEKLQSEKNKLENQVLLVDDKYLLLKKKFFGKSSEKESHPLMDVAPEEINKKVPKSRVLLPSQRYPGIPVIVEDLELKVLPQCDCCGVGMLDSGMFEVSESLTMDAREFCVEKSRRKKYRCGKCHGSIVTTPALPRITPGGSYSDKMIIDVAMSKYCDLVPIERYVAIAGREGVVGLPPQSLIETTHQLADFVRPAVDKILEKEIKQSLVLHADETPHRMLERGDGSYYLWGFSNRVAGYFEIHNTRSGDVASDLLKNSKCEFLSSDVFSGYGKAVRETNEHRAENKLDPVYSLYCNAHARRKFKEAREKFREAQVYLDLYKKIYFLESQVKEKPPNETLPFRDRMRILFEELRTQAKSDVNNYSSKSSMARALHYFLENYDGFTRFLQNPEFPIDNNPQERLLRNPVIGRKTWYGTHSKRGAKTNAVMFTIVESCKLNKINPREYLKNLVASLHYNNEAITPNEFRQLKDSQSKNVG